MTVAHPAIPLAACWLLLIDQLIGSLAFRAALALLVVSRRTRTQSCGLKKQKLVYHGTPRQVVGVLMWSIEHVDGRPCVLHLRRSSASWLNAHTLLHIGHCCEKCVDWTNKNWLPRQHPWTGLQPDFATVIYARRDTNLVEGFVPFAPNLSDTSHTIVKQLIFVSMFLFYCLRGILS